MGMMICTRRDVGRRGRDGEISRAGVIARVEQNLGFALDLRLES